MYFHMKEMRVIELNQAGLPY